MRTFRSAFVCIFAGALIAGNVASLHAAPLSTNVAAMKSMVADSSIQVRWVGWRGGGWVYRGIGGLGYRGLGWGGAALAGAVVGGAIASGRYHGVPYYRGYYPGYAPYVEKYDEYYVPSYGYYGQSYGAGF